MLTERKNFLPCSVSASLRLSGRVAFSRLLALSDQLRESAGQPEFSDPWGTILLVGLGVSILLAVASFVGIFLWMLIVVGVVALLHGGDALSRLYATELGRARSLVTGAASRVRPPASKILSR